MRREFVGSLSCGVLGEWLPARKLDLNAEHRATASGTRPPKTATDGQPQVKNRPTIEPGRLHCSLTNRIATNIHLDSIVRKQTTAQIEIGLSEPYVFLRIAGANAVAPEMACFLQETTLRNQAHE